MNNNTDGNGLDFDIDKTVTLKLQGVTDPQMTALAKLVDRMHFEDWERLAVDAFEADLMADGITRLQNALARAGLGRISAENSPEFT